MPSIRTSFKELLLTLQDESYFQLLHTIHTLPSVIDATAFQQALHQLEAINAPLQAIADFRRYGRRWNVDV